MQKKLLGMAVAAALTAPGLAAAQSAVQVYGTIHLSGNQTRFNNLPDSAGGGSISKFGVNSHASNWGIRSTETLGGGMTAWLQMEFNAQMERRTDSEGRGISANGEGSFRNSGLGLRGGFGNVYYGTWESPWSQTFRLWDVGTIGGWGPTTSIIGRRESTNSGTSRSAQTTAPGGGTGTDVTVQAAPTFGGANNLGYSLWRRFQSSLFYESPLFGGVQLKLAFLPNENKAKDSATSTSENPYAWSGSLTWTGLGGRARAFVANMAAKDWTSVGKTDNGFTVGGGFDFGVANVGATYESYKYRAATGDVKAKEWAVGLAVPLGPGKIGASYARAKDLDGAGVGDTGAKMWNVGYEWALSKRTALGFGVATIDNKQNQGFTWTGETTGPNGPREASPVPNGTDIRNIFVSIRHSF
jgi:predicted porin